VRYNAKPMFSQQPGLSGLVTGLENALKQGPDGTNQSETGKPVLDGHALASLSGRCFISAPRLPELKGNVIEGHMRLYWDYEGKGDVAELCDDNPWHKPKTAKAPTDAARKALGGV